MRRPRLHHFNAAAVRGGDEPEGGVARLRRLIKQSRDCLLFDRYQSRRGYLIGLTRLRIPKADIG
jgi:hypothetical protein